VPSRVLEGPVIDDLCDWSPGAGWREKSLEGKLKARYRHQAKQNESTAEQRSWNRGGRGLHADFFRADGLECSFLFYFSSTMRRLKKISMAIDGMGGAKWTRWTTVGRVRVVDPRAAIPPFLGGSGR